MVNTGDHVMSPEEPNPEEIRRALRHLDEPKEFTVFDGNNRKARRAQKAAERRQRKFAKAA